MATIMNMILADGNLTRNATMAYGMYKGYYTTVLMQRNQIFFIRINYSLAGNMDLGGFKNRAFGYLNQIRVAEKKVTGTNVGDHTIEIQMTASGLAKNSAAMIDRVVNGILDFLRTENAGSGCQLCGVDAYVSGYNVNGSPHFLCSGCAQASINQMEAERQSKLNDQSNPALGLVGALIGSLIGVLCWVLIYQVGFIAGIAGVLIIMAAMKGYTILGKSLDKKGVIIATIISLLMVFVANELSMRIAVYIAFNKGGGHLSFANMCEDWSNIMEVCELWGVYWRDLIVGYFLTFVAGFGTIAQAFRNASGSYSVKKL